MVAANYDVYIEQGATFRMALVYGRKDGTTDVDGNAVVVPYDITGCIARMQIRPRRQGDVLASATTLNGGITIDAPTAGHMIVVIHPDATDALTMRKAKYDLEVEYPSGDVIRVLQGNVTISGNITQDALTANLGFTGAVFDVDEEDVAGPD
jgi:hypothetical protein